MDALSLDRWHQIDTLFAAALERPEDERTAFLRATCGDDPDLYREVLALLASDTAAEAELGESATHFAAPILAGIEDLLSREVDLPTGARVGPYRIEGLLGRGGMGRVYVAERADGAFEKRVALKVVKRGMDTDEILERFRRERQLLAGLDHPHIARLLDGGATDDGRPYIVMECVEGEPITAFADRHRLTVDERLALFGQVAEAVAHAHQRLVVHRDLKPSNILVTDDGQVKLLDFGIARLLDGDGLQTREGFRLLTPEYAAPEQIRGEPVTTATDVFSLGVLLFELLTGRRPSEMMKGDAEGPARPSTAVLEEAAGARSTMPERLRRRLRGDLDQILMKALRSDPARRYRSVEALGEDLRRARMGLPVKARPESALYRAGKFVRRHRFAVASVAAFVLLLAGSVVVLGLQQRQTLQERDRAERELSQKREVTDFLTDLFGAADPGEARGDTLTAYDLLARGAERAEIELDGQPAVQGHLLHVLSHIHERLGQLDEAQRLAERSLEVRANTLGERHPDVATSENQLARIAHSRGDYDRAEAHLRRALQLRRELLPPSAPELAESEMNLGLLLTYSGLHDEAETLLRGALARDRTRLGDTHADVATDLNNLAVLLFHKGDYVGSEAALREALAIRRVIYEEPHPRIALTLNNLAAIVRRMGDPAAAEPLFRESLAMSRRIYGDEHADVASTLSNLGAVVTDLGRTEEAEPLLREAVHISSAVHGEHPELADALSNLGSLLLDLHRVDEAEHVLGEALEMHRRTRGEEHAGTALAIYHLGRAAEKREDLRAAEQLFREALALQERALPAGHDETALTRGHLGHILLLQNHYHEAEALLLRSRTDLANAYGAEDERVALVSMWLLELRGQFSREGSWDDLLPDPH